MGKRVRVSENCPDKGMVGVEAVIVKDVSMGSGSVLLGLPLDSTLGWYASYYSTKYRCWWISQDYLEPIITITRSKFK